MVWRVGSVFLLLAAAAAQGDGLRCGNALVTEGDHLLRVQHLCGEPAYTDQYVVLGSLAVFDPRLRIYTEVSAPVTVEEWTYNFGSTRFMRRLRFENGRLIDIERLNYGY